MSIIWIAGTWVLALIVLTAVIGVARLTLVADLHGFSGLTREIIDLAARDVIMAAATVLGVVSRGVHDELERRRGPRIRITAVVRSASTSKSFWTAILLSPILLVGFRSSLAEVSNLFLITVLSYQNGFFFRSVVKHGDKSDE